MKRLPFSVYSQIQRVYQRFGVRVLIQGAYLSWLLGEEEQKPDVMEYVAIGGDQKAFRDYLTKEKPEAVTIQGQVNEVLFIRRTEAEDVVAAFSFCDSIEQYLRVAAEPAGYDAIARIIYTARNLETEPESVTYSVDGEEQNDPGMTNRGETPLEIREAVTKRIKQRGKHSAVVQVSHDGGDKWFVKIEKPATTLATDLPEDPDSE